MKLILSLFLSLVCLISIAQYPPAERLYSLQMSIPRIDTSTATDVDAQRFIDSAGITNPTIKKALNRLALDLKGTPNALYATYNSWDRFLAIYPFVGGTATSHKWNFKNPVNADTAHRLVFTGTFVHNDSGARGSGLSGCLANPFFTATSVISAENSYCFSVYNLTPGLLAAQEIGGNLTGAGSLGRISIAVYGTNVDDISRTSIISSGGQITCIAAGNLGLGFFAVSHKIGSTAFSSINGRLFTGNGSNFNTASSTNPITIFYAGNGGFNAARMLSFASIGRDITQQQLLAFSNAVQQFQKTIGRAVN